MCFACIVSFTYKVEAIIIITYFPYVETEDRRG